MKHGTRLGVTALVGALTVAACDQAPTSTETDIPAALSRVNRSGKAVGLSDYSVTPSLVKVFEPGVETFSILSSDDVLPATPDFQYGGSADGSGLLMDPGGRFTLVTNHEDNYSVSRVLLDENFQPMEGEYIVDSDAGQWRLCSATLATPEEHGFGPVYITAGESGIESMIHAVDPYGSPSIGAGTTNLLSAFGRWNTENAVPLPAKAYRNQTVVLIGDDDSGPGGGQIAMYVGPRGDLDSGDLFVMSRTDGNIRERDMVVGESYPVEFNQIQDQRTSTGAEIQAQAIDLNAIRFGRVEDLDYRKSGNGREIYFNVTGQGPNRSNADESRSVYGRVYRLTLDNQSPTQGTLELVLDGDDPSGPASMFQNPDNILVTRNYVYIQEDPNGYGDETHDAYLYQYRIATGELKVVMELDHNRGATGDDPYGGANSRFGSWEYGAMLDVTDKLGGSGAEGTFLLNIQPHTWRGEEYENPDGGALRASENQASQVILVRGLPR